MADVRTIERRDYADQETITLTDHTLTVIATSLGDIEVTLNMMRELLEHMAGLELDENGVYRLNEDSIKDGLS